MNQAIIYSRISPRPVESIQPGQDDPDSIVTQLDRCRAYCVSRGWEVSHEFSDVFKSGKRADNRPELQLAIEAACKAKAAIVCYSLSRLARSTRDALAICDKLNRCGAKLVVLDCQLDSTSAIGRMVLTMLSSFYEFEVSEIAKRTSDAMRRYQADGRRMSSRWPIGWKADPSSPVVETPSGPMAEKGVVDPYESEVVERIVSEYENGYTPNNIASGLMADGVMVRGKKMTAWQVQRVVKRAGILVQKRGRRRKNDAA